MESNYVKSARIKLKHLSIKDYKDFKENFDKIYEIINLYVFKEIKMQIAAKPSPYYQTFVNHREISLEPELKPWQMQTLDYYTRNPLTIYKGVN